MSSNLEDYIDVEKSERDFVTKAQLDFSEILMEENKDYPKLGKYKLYINCDEEKYEVEINVKDTTAPEIKELKSPLIYVKDVNPTHEEILKNFEINDLNHPQTSIDDSKVNYSKAGDYNAIITSADLSQNEAKKEITIKIENPTITLNKHDIKLSVNQTQTLTSKVVGKDNKVVYKSSNSAIVSVDSQGKITGEKEGNAIITATCNGVEDKCNVSVKGVYIEDAYSAIAYVKKYLKEHNKYIPEQIGFHDASYGKRGYEIHGFDDMGDHIATSFWYSVSHDGKIYDETFQGYVLK